MRIVGIGRGLFALASGSLAVLGLVYRDLAPLGQSLAAPSLAQDAWVYGPSIVLLAASAGLCFPSTAQPSALAVCAYDAFWAAAGIPSIISKPVSIDAWYGSCEALTSLAGAGILYALLRPQSAAAGGLIGSRRIARIAQGLFGSTCVFYGWSHFVYADYTASMVPAWLPDQSGFAYLTGLGHIAAGAGIALAILPRLAALLEALMMSLFLLLVWVPSFFARPRPTWAGSLENQLSELVVTLVLLAAAWMVAISLRHRRWSTSRSATAPP